LVQVDRGDLSPAEWTVLALVDEEPAHGFAVLDEVSGQ
jgi:hypothetical protein